MDMSYDLYFLLNLKSVDPSIRIHSTIHTAHLLGLLGLYSFHGRSTYTFADTFSDKLFWPIMHHPKIASWTERPKHGRTYMPRFQQAIERDIILKKKDYFEQLLDI